jgi:hypothetical protein
MPDAEGHQCASDWVEGQSATAQGNAPRVGSYERSDQHDAAECQARGDSQKPKMHTHEMLLPVVRPALDYRAEPLQTHRIRTPRRS